MYRSLPNIITCEQAQKFLGGVDIYKLIERKEIKTIRILKRIFIYKEDILEWIASNDLLRINAK